MDTLSRPTSLPSRIADALREDIAAGRFPAGSRLPAEAALATGFGVSRPIVREAIALLKADGVISTRKGSGAYVSDTPGGEVWRMASPTAGGPTLSQLLELRITVETECAALAAARRTDADIVAIRRAWDAMAAAGDDLAQAAAADIAFHHAIAHATHNPCFTGLTDFVAQRMLAARHAAWENAARLPDSARGAHEEHEALCEAIVAGDPDAARAAARRHLEAAAQRLGLPIGDGTTHGATDILGRER